MSLTVRNEEKCAKHDFWATENPLEHPEDHFELGNSIIARGQFGVLFMSGKFLNNLVAIKLVNELSSFDHFKALLAELSVLSQLKRHPYILTLLGSSTNISKKTITLAFEFCSNGNLMKMLRNSQSYFKYTFVDITPVGNERGDVPVILNMNARTLLLWTLEITEAMEFLAYNRVVHGDLAARNILITCNFKTKICNFCLSKKLSTSTNKYTPKFSKLTLPLEWLAPETIRDSTFSLESDIWSFGVVLWEIYSLGRVPYPTCDVNQKFWRCIVDGYRLEKPKYVTDDIHMIMNRCWNISPTERPSFSTIRQLVLQQFFQLKPKKCYPGVKLKDTKIIH